MHTDEYQISLNREIGVCKSKIASAQKAISKLENTYGLNTEQLTEGHACATVPEKDLAEWREHAAALKFWSGQLLQYEELYLRHKR